MRFKDFFIFLTVLIFCGLAPIFSQDKPQSKRISSFDKSGKNAAQRGASEYAGYRSGRNSPLAGCVAKDE